MNLGTLVDADVGTTLNIDLPRLLETRMLVQANSGGTFNTISATCAATA